MRARREPQRAAVRGFTLLEVLVALTIVAVLLVGLVHLGAAGATNRQQLESRTLAHWVALNQVNELRLAATWPQPGSSEGSEDMAGRHWTWQREVSVTPDPGVREVRVAVGTEEDGRLSVLTAYLVQPPGAPGNAN